MRTVTLEKEGRNDLGLVGSGHPELWEKLLYRVMSLRKGVEPKRGSCLIRECQSLYVK